MMEAISHYNANGSNVYAFMLDASKAFDRVRYFKLKRKVSPLVLRLLLYMYTNNKDGLVADVIAKFFIGYNMFMGDSYKDCCKVQVSQTILLFLLRSR